MNFSKRVHIIGVVQMLVLQGKKNAAIRSEIRGWEATFFGNGGGIKKNTDGL